MPKSDGEIDMWITPSCEWVLQASARYDEKEITLVRKVFSKEADDIPWMRFPSIFVDVDRRLRPALDEIRMTRYPSRSLNHNVLQALNPTRLINSL